MFGCSIERWHHLYSTVPPAREAQIFQWRRGYRICISHIYHLVRRPTCWNRGEMILAASLMNLDSRGCLGMDVMPDDHRHVKACRFALSPGAPETQSFRQHAEGSCCQRSLQKPNFWAIIPLTKVGTTPTSAQNRFIRFP